MASTSEPTSTYTEAEVGADGSTSGFAAGENGEKGETFTDQEDDVIHVIASNTTVLVILGIVFLILFAIIMYHVNKRKKEVRITLNN